MATGLQRAEVFSWIEEPDERAPIRSTGYGEQFIAAGNATTTTTAMVVAGANNDWVGYIMRCLGATNTENIGVDVEILQFNAATGALTHTAFPAATTLGDTMELFLPPDPICSVTTGAINTVTASVRNEADYTPRGGAATDYWIGDYVVCRQSDNVPEGEKQAVTAFNAATGAFTHTNLSTTTTLGDLFYLRRYPKTWGPVEVSWKREDLEHVAQTSTFDREPSIPGSKSWTANVALPLKASGSSAGNGVAGVVPPELAPPLACVFSRVQSTGEVTVTGSTAHTTSSVSVTHLTASQFPIGSCVHDAAGRMAWVTATAASDGTEDVITVRPPLNRAMVTGEILYGGYSFEPMLSGQRTMTLDCFVGGTTNLKLYGGMPTVKIVDFARNSVPKIQLAYQGNYWLETQYPKPSGLSPTFDTVIPIDAKDSYAYLTPTGSNTNVRLVLKTAEIDFGIVLADEPGVTLPDGAYGMRIVDMVPRITVTMVHDTSSPVSSFAELLRYMGSQTFTLMLQHGHRVGYSVGVYAHRCKWLSPTHGVADGLREITLTAEVLGSNLTTMPAISFGTA